jgi:hypothetical protein
VNNIRYLYPNLQIVEFGSNYGTGTKEIAIDQNACPRGHEPEFKPRCGCWGWLKNDVEVLESAVGVSV